jgi:uncharacterized protein (UPF0332 family)
MFYAASAVLLTKDIRISKHSGVISAFGLHFAKGNILDKKYHSMIIKAFSDRDVADYSIFGSVGKDVATKRVEEAREFVEAMAHFLRKQGFVTKIK